MKMQLMNTILKKFDKKILLGAFSVALVAVLSIGYIGFGKRSEQPLHAKQEAPVFVETKLVEPEPIDSVLSAAGALSSRNISVLSSKVMGRVVELNVKEGDYVAQGRLLIRIESGEISAQVYQAGAAFNSAKLHYDRIKTLFDEQAATRMEMDQATLGLESARAGLNAAKAMESYTLITAPISGQIVEKKINPGEMALPGQPVLKIEDNRNLRLEVTMKEQDIRHVRSGQAVTVRIDALPDREISGRVSQVVPAADIRTHSFIVKIDIPAETGLFTGMYGRAIFPVGTRQAIMVPRSALVELSGITGVYLVSREGKAVFQMMQPGELRGDAVEAVTGLKAGDRVIANGSNVRIDGMTVQFAGNGK